MRATKEHGGMNINEAELEKIFGSLRIYAESFGGHFRLIKGCECFRCGNGDGRPGMYIRIPPEKGTVFPFDNDLPLVVVNIRFCCECAKWLFAEDDHREMLVEQILDSIRVSSKGE